MVHFCFNNKVQKRLGQTSLFVGQEAVPIQLRGVSINDPVLSAFINQTGDSFFYEVIDQKYDPSKSLNYKEFILTGAKSGLSTLTALDFDRVGNSKILDELSIEVKDDPDESDLIYTGRWLYWKSNFPSSLPKTSSRLFAATSGTSMFQTAYFQKYELIGPIPEGTYRLLTKIDNLQASVEAANRVDSLLAFSNPRHGIQFLPVGVMGPVSSDWGTLRVRLEPRSGDMHGRAGFYLHNSHKGYSHGCIEVGASIERLDFFTMLLAHARDPNRKSYLSLRVRYGHAEQSTLGKTFS
jgi:hypothetical protein